MVQENSSRWWSRGWMAEEFPLNREMPEELIIDCEVLEPPVYPLFWLRLRTFLDWHHAQGRSLCVVPPADDRARKGFDQMKVVDSSYVELRGSEKPDSRDGIAILPLTPLADHTTVEEVAAATREILEYQYTDVSPLGHACYMAVSELCGNAIEHGRNGLGAYVAVQRFNDPDGVPVGAPGFMRGLVVCCRLRCLRIRWV